MTVQRQRQERDLYEDETQTVLESLMVELQHIVWKQSNYYSAHFLFPENMRIARLKKEAHSSHIIAHHIHHYCISLLLSHEFPFPTIHNKQQLLIYDAFIIFISNSNVASSTSTYLQKSVVLTAIVILKIMMITFLSFSLSTNRLWYSGTGIHYPDFQKSSAQAIKFIYAAVS
jgi:hypothetical protein